jgi:hypothetical protein
VLPSVFVWVITPEDDWLVVLPSAFVWLTAPELFWLIGVLPFGLQVYVSVR